MGSHLSQKIVAETRINTDVLVIGSGLAGLLLSFELAENGATVTLVSKGGLGDSNTAAAQGGVAAVMLGSSVDSPEAHLRDTLTAGAGLTDEAVAKHIIEQGSTLITRLSQLGVEFDLGLGLSGRLECALEGGHSHARVVHSRDATGKAISNKLIARVKQHPKVQILEQALAIELIVANACCQGALVLVNGGYQTILARQVVLAAGGIGQVFERTTNPDVATGDGIALAWHAGARLVDLEFVQFHPTALCHAGAPAFLISEAVRGAGARLLDKNGRQFARRFHPDGELATRDIVARGIYTIMREQDTPCVWLDLRPLGAKTLLKQFPNIISKCREFEVDPLGQSVPVAPAAHYFMGGIWTDENGQTTVPGLYAIGECASVGLHGANRLASNSLLEAGVMALRVAKHIFASKVERLPYRDGNSVVVLSRTVPCHLQSFRKLMFDHAGLVRDGHGLKQLVCELSLTGMNILPVSRLAVEVSSMYLVGKLIAGAALERQESRGSQFRLDYPYVDDACFRKRFYVSKSDSGWISVPGSKASVPALIA